MAKKRKKIPQYGTTTLNGIEYFRTRITDTDGKRVTLYGRTREELYDKVEEAKRILKKAEDEGVKIRLPKDVHVTKEFSNDTPDKMVDVDKIPEGYQGLDIGPKTVMEFEKELQGAKTVLWNGPLGVCEFSKFTIGTERIAEAIANTDAVSVVGGGDSVAAIKKLGLADQFTHISTGGGASLELLEGKTLPGLAALTDKEMEKEERQETKSDITKNTRENPIR